MKTKDRMPSAVLGLMVLVVACGEKSIDWSAPENLVYVEKSDTTDDGVRLEYWSLVDAPCKAIYEALVDVEHYPEFIPGVDQTQIVNRTENSKVVLISPRSVGKKPFTPKRLCRTPENQRPSSPN